MTKFCCIMASLSKTVENCLWMKSKLKLDLPMLFWSFRGSSIVILVDVPRSMGSKFYTWFTFMMLGLNSLP